MAISPDSRRFYDIRGYYANAWEPSVLSNFAEAASKDMDSISDGYESTPPETSFTIQGAIDPVTALAVSPKGRFYCSGTERGIVRLHDLQLDKVSVLYASRSKSWIQEIAWSADGTCVAFVDVSRQLILLSITPPTAPGEEAVAVQKAVIQLRRLVKGRTLQLLLRPDASRILVHTQEQAHVVDVLTATLLKSFDLEHSPVQKWITSPDDPNLLVGFAANCILMLDWDLCKKCEHTMLVGSAADSTSPNAHDIRTTCKVDQVLVSYDKKHILVQLSDHESNSSDKQLLFLDSKDVAASSQQPQNGPGGSASSIHLTTVFSDIPFSNLAMAISVVWKDRLIFISQDFSLCITTLRWGAEAPSVRPSLKGTTSGQAKSTTSGRFRGPGSMAEKKSELFTLPGDWVSRDCLSFCTLWAVEKALLCPRNGEVGVIKSSHLA